MRNIFPFMMQHDPNYNRNLTHIKKLKRPGKIYKTYTLLKWPHMQKLRANMWSFSVTTPTWSPLLTKTIPKFPRRYSISTENESSHRARSSSVVPKSQNLGMTTKRISGGYHNPKIDHSSLRSHS